MSDETSIEDRLERAQSQKMNVTLVDSDPLVVQVHNEDSDRIHTVVPDSLHCSCEDHTYRGAICKHLLVLLDAEGHIGDVTREAIKERRNSLEQESTKLREKVQETESRIDHITEALNVVGASHAMEKTGEEVAEAIQEVVEEADEDPGEEDDEFESMVEDLTGGEA